MKKMNTFEKIKLKLKHGIMPIVKCSSGHYAICKSCDELDTKLDKLEEVDND